MVGEDRGSLEKSLAMASTALGYLAGGLLREVTGHAGKCARGKRERKWDHSSLMSVEIVYRQVIKLIVCPISPLLVLENLAVIKS